MSKYHEGKKESFRVVIEDKHRIRWADLEATDANISYLKKKYEKELESGEMSFDSFVCGGTARFSGSYVPLTS